VTFAAALLAAGGVAVLGYAAGWLTRDGAIAAAIVGGLILASAGLAGITLLAFFFLSGSVLTYVGRYGLPGSAERPRRGRTWRQVAANGGWAAMGALLVPGEPALGWPILVGALAAAQADTWGTEIGGRSPSPPRLITTGQPVQAGTSGGVTLLGTFAGILGAGLMGCLAWMLNVSGSVALAAAAGGLLGTLADSLLGATIQGMYHCDRCTIRTEHRTHWCGSTARLTRGWAWVDNDGVNLVATGLGAATAVGLGW
jgi:uncharacterized protein (TIGR00297 family)